MKKTVVFSTPDKTFRKMLTVLSVVFGVILPVITNFLLSLWASYIYGDVMKVELYSVLKSVISVFGTINMYSMFGIIIISVLRYELCNSKSVILFGFVKIVLTYIGYFAIPLVLSVGNFLSNLSANLVYLGVNAAVDIILLFGVVFISAYLRKAFLKDNISDITIKKFVDFKNPILTTVFWGACFVSFILLSEKITSTFSDIYLYGADNLNFSEVMTLVSPYVSWLIKSFSGYVIMFLLCLYSEKALNELRKEKQNEV